MERISKPIFDYSPIIVGFSCIAQNFDLTLQLAKYIKSKNSDIQICLGGPHASCNGEEILREFDFVDSIVIGECETTIASIIKKIIYNDDSNVYNVLFRTARGIRAFPRKQLLADLDKLSFLELDYCTPLSELDIEIGRGCPYACYFCSTSIYWLRNYRKKAVKKIVSEVFFYLREYGITQYNFEHDMLTHDVQYVISLCDALIEEKLNIRWTCSARVDTLSDQIIEKMSNAGCYSIFLGIESGSQRMQKVINKNIDLLKVDKVVKKLIEKNISVTLAFVFGFPEETIDDVYHTLNFMYKYMLLKNVTVLLTRCTYFSGTPLFNKYKSQLTENVYNEDYWLLHKAPLDQISRYSKSIFSIHWSTPLLGNIEYLDIFINFYFKIIISFCPENLNDFEACGLTFYDVYQFMIPIIKSTKHEYIRFQLKTIPRIVFFRLIVEKFKNAIDALKSRI